LAEAYCKSITRNKNIVVSSSGIEATVSRNYNGPISWYAMRLIKRNNLIPFMTWNEQQTTKDLLQKVDLLVCMSQVHLDMCQHQYGYEGKPFEVWDILDLNEMTGFIPSNTPGVDVDTNHIKLTEETYSTIKQKVNDLVLRIF
jgi:protein-tyrosine-phosphatase